MKVTIDEAKNKIFTPVTVNITVEDVKEARLLYHLFNRTNLKEVINGDTLFTKGYGEYSTHMATRLDDYDTTVPDVLRDAVEATGQEV